jgi:hypothetical protein
LNNNYRVTKLIALLVLVAGCGSKETAEPQREAKVDSKPRKETKVESEAMTLDSKEADIPTVDVRAEIAKVVDGTATAEDCVKARADMARLRACREEVDEELIELENELGKDLTDPNVSDEVKGFIMQGCRDTYRITSQLSCDLMKMKKKKPRRRE